MAAEPAVKRAIAFFDGQNLYRHAKDAFGHHHPNYDPKRLFDAVCADKRWVSRGVRFYTGTPAREHNAMWHGYWANRLLAMSRSGIIVERRPIRYRRHDAELADGTVETRFCTHKIIVRESESWFKLPNCGSVPMNRYDLTDFEWSVIEPLLPNKPRGVPRVDDRRVLNGIMWVLRSGAPWRDLPERYGPYTTCYNRFNRWRKKGIWDQLMDAIVEAYDGNIQMIDSSSVRVHQHAAGSKRGVRIVAWVVPEAD